MYYEIHRNDIVFDNLRELPSLAKGVKRWGAPGATVYQVVDKNLTPTLKRHRFALLPPNYYQGSSNSLRSDQTGFIFMYTKLK